MGRFSVKIFLLAGSFVPDSFLNAQALPLQALDGNVQLSQSLQVDLSGLTIWQEEVKERVGQGRVDWFLPVARVGKREWALQMRSNGLSFGRDHLAGSGVRAIPQEMANLSVGFFVRERRPNEDVWAMDFSLGRSGVQLFDEGASTSMSTNLYWAMAPSSQKKKWIFLVSYSNSRSTFNNVPLPGAIYLQEWKDEGFQSSLALGLPVIFGFFRGPMWSGNLLLTPFSSSAELGRVILGPFSVFGRFAWQPQAFLVSEGPKSRVIFDEFKSSLGLRGPIARGTFLSLQLSYADGRSVFWGDSAFDKTGPGDRLPDELSLGLQVSMRF